MATQTLALAAQFLKRWFSEDRSLEKAASELQAWMRKVEQRGIPHFGETGTRLQPFRAMLVEHFDDEDKMLDELAKNYSKDSPEIAAMRRQSTRDHNCLLADLDDYCRRLNQLEPPFQSWQAAMEEFDLLICRLELHEDQESESLQAMMPGE